MLPEDLSFVDIETTGASLRNDRVLEIGIIRTKNGRVVDEFSSVIDPQLHVSEYILNFTGIATHEIDHAPTFYDVSDRIYEMLDNSYFVAHNVNFDYSFIKKEFKNLGFNFNPQKLCTVKLSRKLFPEFRHHNLDAVILRNGIDCTARHRAMGDAQAIHDFFFKSQERFEPQIFSSAVKFASSNLAYPVNVPSSVIKDLPENPGVYIFYGKGDVPLYVGKSTNIRQRVLSHFYDSTNSSTELKLAQQTIHVEWINTAGELGALLKESQMIKKLCPVYNIKLRNSRKLVWLDHYLDENGYERIRVNESYPEPGELENCIGTYKSKKSLNDDLERAYHESHLCKKLLGLESGKGACFGYHLGTCSGACVGEEAPIKYNLKFYNHFFKNKFTKWPYPGPISIHEYDDETGIGNEFVIDNWCLEGSDAFDLDTYKILKRFISDSRNSSKITFVKC